MDRRVYHWLLPLFLVISMVAGSVYAYTQECPPIFGDGSDNTCSFAGSCAEFGGTTYMFCTTVGCSHSLACQGQWQYSAEQCLIFGCWAEAFYNICSVCPNGGR